MVRHRARDAALVVGPAIGADVEVEVAVVVVVGRGERVAVRYVAGDVADAAEAAAAVVLEDQHGRAAGEHQVRVAVVVEIDEQPGQGPLQEVDRRFGRTVVERAFPILHVEPVRQAALFGQEEVLQAVAVDIRDRDSLPAGLVVARRLGDPVEPGVRRLEQLLPVARVVADRGLRDVDEERTAGSRGLLVVGHLDPQQQRLAGAARRQPPDGRPDRVHLSEAAARTRRRLEVGQRREPLRPGIDRVQLEVHPRRPVAGQPPGEGPEGAAETLGAAVAAIRATRAPALDGEGRPLEARGQFVRHEARRLEGLIHDRRHVAGRHGIGAARGHLRKPRSHAFELRLSLFAERLGIPTVGPRIDRDGKVHGLEGRGDLRLPALRQRRGRHDRQCQHDDSDDPHRRHSNVPSSMIEWWVPA